MAIRARQRQVSKNPPALNLHIEPKNPIELEDMLASLATIGKRYHTFAREQLDIRNAEDHRLYVSSIKPGSIDISLIPDLLDVGKVAAGAFVAAGAGDTLEAVKGFAESIKSLLDVFKKPVKAKDAEGISVRDCDDAVNIVKPIATAGGSQQFNVNNVQGDQIIQFHVNSPEATRIMENALHHRESLLLPEFETKKSVALVWQKVDRSEARVVGSRSPDKGRIDEITRGAKSVLFHENMADVKAQIMEEALYQKVYYVDVEIIRVNDRIQAYRVVGYHGSDELDEDSEIAE